MLTTGGGEYALFASDSIQDAERPEELLATKFENDWAIIVDFSLSNTGMQVALS